MMRPAGRFASQDSKFSSLSTTARKKLAPSMSGVSSPGVPSQCSGETIVASPAIGRAKPLTPQATKSIGRESPAAMPSILVSRNTHWSATTAPASAKITDVQARWVSPVAATVHRPSKPLRGCPNYPEGPRIHHICGWKAPMEGASVFEGKSGRAPGQTFCLDPRAQTLRDQVNPLLPGLPVNKVPAPLLLSLIPLKTLTPR